MAIITLFLISLSWSFIGVLVKTASFMTSSWVITLSRFFFGVVFLGLFLYIRDRKIIIHWRTKWIWIAVIGKVCNYTFENMAIAMGYSYGNVLVAPIQSIILLLVSAFYFREDIPKKDWIAAILCFAGIVLVSWNGTPLSVLFHNNLIITLLFTLSAVGAAFHVLSQKILIQEMDSGNMNFSVFLFCMLFTIIPIPFTRSITGSFSIWAVFALILSGFITGFSFYLYANTLKKVPFLMAVIISNASVIFSLLWSWLVFRDPITLYVIMGAVIFLIGIILLNIPNKLFTANRGFLSMKKHVEKNGLPSK